MKAVSLDKNEIIKEAELNILTQLKKAREELKGATNQQQILAFKFGKSILGVGIRGEVTYCCSAADASVILTGNEPEEALAWTPIVKNGNGEQAKLYGRKAAIEFDIDCMEDLLGLYKQMAA